MIIRLRSPISICCMTTPTAPSWCVRCTRHPCRLKAKDILRASGLSPLGMSNAHVERDLKKIQSGTALSPLLLVRQEGQRTVVADGYHRLCAVYRLDEDASIPCKIV